MIDFYYCPPNGHKITIFLEESGAEYDIKPIHISEGEQVQPAFLNIGPNNRIPAIGDHMPEDGAEPISIFESGQRACEIAKSINVAPTVDEKAKAILFGQDAKTVS
jgi:GST-like protein